MTLDGPHDLFVHNLQEMYYIENELVDVLAELSSDTPDEKLSSSFAEHRTATEEQARRLETVFEAVNATPEARQSATLEGLKRDREEFLELVGSNDLKTPFYLAAGIKTEQFEVTGYQSLLMLADQMDLGDEVKGPLEQNLDEEKSALRSLQTMEKGTDIKSMIQNLL
jgi:ferritin-like metal-binding protein YciE